ncbi:MAG TPA: hypothetical protein VFT22_32045, partial [Kofleriaceae bacterium]|nr:hypothetical protein [Kofleriaceae bacterium]
AGVELVREQLEHVLAEHGSPPRYDLSDEGLIVWPAPGYQIEAVYDLRAAMPSSRLRGGPYDGELPSLVGRHAIFGREPVSWARWTAVWDQLARGEPPRPILLGPSLLRPPPPRAHAIAI